MFDVEVNAGLLWVDTDLDGIVHCSSNRSGVSRTLSKVCAYDLPLHWDEDVE